MGKITGIGGIFFKCENPQLVRKWYADKLGIQSEDFGAVFSSQSNETVWMPFRQDSDEFSPSTKDFGICFHVEGIEEIVADLKTKSVNVLDEIVEAPHGKFVHILDIEGNKIQLWESVA